MEGVYANLALCGGGDECAGTGTVFLPITEVCNGTVSLIYLFPPVSSLLPYETAPKD